VSIRWSLPGPLPQDVSLMIGLGRMSRTWGHDDQPEP
jgi:hypothetical protein